MKKRTTVLLSALFIFVAVAPTWAQLSYDSDKYHSFEEMTAFLREAAEKYPDLTKLYSIGKSFEGRELWMLEITNKKSGDPGEKPALYINGSIDSSEVVTTEGVLYTIQKLLEGYSQDPTITETLDRLLIYFVPRLMPDNAERYITTPHNARSLSAEPGDADGDGKSDEDPDNDVDGDGHIVRMRIKDPAGEWRISSKDPRIMVRRRAGELEGTFYRVMSEGLDDDKDGKYNEDGQGGVDPNRNYPGNWMPESIQRGAGPYPMYVQEVRTEVEFIEAHRNIAGYINHHSSGGVVLRPSTAHSDAKIPSKDLEKLKVIAAMILDETGYWLATSVYDWRVPPGKPDTKPGQTWRKPDGSLGGDPRGPRDEEGGRHAAAILKEAVNPMGDGGHPSAYHAYGGTIEFTYEALGIISYASEQWRCAFDNDLDEDGKISEFERLDWNDKHFGGELFINWTPFEHPQLGEVEIGGWKKFTTSSPPPGKYLEEESERQFKFNMVMAKVMPRIDVKDVKAEPLGDGVYKVVAEVENLGYIPTATEAAVKLKRAEPVKVKIGGKGIEVLGSESEVSLGHLDGRPSKPAKATWVIRAKAPFELTVSASAPAAGRDAMNVTVEK